MPSSFTTIFSGVAGFDFYGFLLPWLFTFAIVYGLLMKASLFGANVNKQVSVALAFVIAFFVTGLGGPQLASFFVNFFGGTSIFLAGILVFILFWTLISGGEKDPKKFHTGVLGFIFIVIVAAVLFLSSTGTFSGFVFLDAGTASLIFWFVIIIIAGYLITREPPAKKEG